MGWGRAGVVTWGRARAGTWDGVGQGWSHEGWLAERQRLLWEET